MEIPRDLVAKFFERKSLLWICQRTELEAEADLHTDSTPLDEAVSRYKPAPAIEDLQLANIFWEACWTESIVDHFYEAIGQVSGSDSDGNPPPERRMPYRLTTDPDSEGQIDRRRFLPIYEINGTNRAGDPDGVHGGSLARRLAYRMGLIRRLENFPGRALVVVGAQESADLDTIRIALEFIPSNTAVAILWPSDVSMPENPEFSGRVEVHFLRGTRAELVDALVEIGVPRPTSTPRLGVRFGSSTLELREEDLVGIDQEFILIRDSDLRGPQSAGNHDLDVERLWRSEPDDWLPFAGEMVFRRHYQPFASSNMDLIEGVISELEGMTKAERPVSMTLTIPATSGSGITTALRHAAFIAAQSGFPTLLCKPTSQRLSVDKLGAFLTRLQERSREQLSAGDEKPTLIIFDREHRGIEQVSELSSSLASRGRRSLVVEVIPPSGDDAEGPSLRRPRGRHIKAQEFRGVVDETELRSLAQHFSKLYAASGVPIPGLPEWIEYQKSQAVQSPSGEQFPESLFWVALRFFVGEGDPNFDLGQWVVRTFEERVRDAAGKVAVRYIAAFSSFGIAVPLVPLLRSSGTIKALDMNILPTLRLLSKSEDLLQWGDSEEHLHDQTISFKHRLIAIQLLRQLDISGWDDRLRECWGLLESLEATALADSWLVETLVFEALRVDRFDSAIHFRLPTILETLDHIPSVIAARSAPTQHHWGRALGRKAREVENVNDQILYYTEAIEKLALACDLAESGRGREHPRNIYNSLGVMRSQLSRIFRDNSEVQKAEALWQSAAASFELALRYGSDNFVVLSAYARRLIEHARDLDDVSQALGDVASALSYLSKAEDAGLLADSLSIDDAASIELDRNRAWQVIDGEQADRHIEKLISDGDEIGTVLKAYRTLEGMTEEDWHQGTSSQLSAAYDVLHQAYTERARNHSWRYVFLLYRVVSALRSQRYNFGLRLALLDDLDSLSFRWDSGLRFAQATLCYQSGDFHRGFAAFRTLRAAFVSGSLQPMRLASFWRDPLQPTQPRPASIRIQRIESDWVAYGEVPEMDGQRMLVRPRWFEIQPKVGDVRQCHIAFETYGPVAVPTDRRLTSLIN